jgi:hypothetical protein
MHIHSPLGGIGVLSLSTRRTRSLDWFPYACLAIMELHTEAQIGYFSWGWNTMLIMVRPLGSGSIGGKEQGPLRERFTSLLSITAESVASVAWALRSGEWVIPFRLELWVDERNERCNLLWCIHGTQLSADPDGISWTLDPSGKFSVRSPYQKLCQGASTTLSGPWTGNFWNRGQG